MNPGRSDTLHAAVIGMGMGSIHAAACADSPWCHLSMVCDRNPALLDEAQARFSGVRVTTDAMEVLEDPGIGLICVATWDDSHADLVTTALERGRHVFVEKPLCLHEHDLFRIRRALESRPGTRLSGNLILRRCPRFRNLRDSVARGDLGQVYCIEGDYLFGRPHKLTEGWRTTQPFYSLVHGGMVHLADLVLWIHNRQAVEVQAISTRIALDGTAYRFPDTFLALIRFDDGSIAKLGVHGACMRPHFHALTVYGTEGTFTHGPGGGERWMSRDPELPPESFPGAYPGYAKGDLMCAFIDALHFGHEPEVTEEDLFKVTSLCMAVEQSAIDGQAKQVLEWPKCRETR